MSYDRDYACDHNWTDFTGKGDSIRREVCTKCGAQRTSPPDVYFEDREFFGAIGPEVKIVKDQTAHLT